MESKTKAIMNIAVFLIALLLISSVRGKTSASVDFNQEDITLNGPDGYSCVIEYIKIKPDSVKLLGEGDLADPGSAVTGGENSRYRWGRWENDDFGTYDQCILRKVDAAILFETVDGETVIFNVESKLTTESFVDALREMVVYSQTGESEA